MKISLPISKSIANRILLLQAIHGDPLMRVSSDMPDDVLVLHDALQQIRELYGTPKEYASSYSSPLYGGSEGGSGVIPLKNCGTALRFLQVHIATCYPGAPITLTGDPRLMERDGKPTSQTISARILHGEPIPVSPDESPYITMSRRIKELYDAQTSLPFREGSGLGFPLGLEYDWSSAAFWYEYVAIHGGELLLEGLKKDSLQGDRIVADIYAQHFGVQTEFVPEGALIRKTTSLPFWEGSGVGYYSLPFTGEELCSIERPVDGRRTNQGVGFSLNFDSIPDLYPAVALTCEKLSIDLIASGTDRLRFKESDRLEAVRLHEVRNDHRMAMALIVADWKPLPSPKPLSDSPLKGEGLDLQRIIAKSYPTFLEQFNSLPSGRVGVGFSLPCGEGRGGVITHITPIKGVNDDNLGKKHALSKLIHAATSEYIWLHDDDIILPPAAERPNLTFPEGKELSADLYILPLKMESPLPFTGEGLRPIERPVDGRRTNQGVGYYSPPFREGLGVGFSEGSGVGLSLQIAEYAAIQELTMRTAKRGHAVMCSGANLIVRREAWLACEPDLHPEIPSGDDMFLLEAMKRRGMTIAVIDEPDFTAVVRPAPTWRAFLRQRMRWAGKAPKYTDPDILRCGALVVAANLLQLLFPPILLIKFPIEYSLIRHRESLYTVHQTSHITHQTSNIKPRTPWYVALLLELLYPFYLLLSLIGGLFRQHKW